MRALMAFLADVALAHPDGKVYVLGGGVEILLADQIPHVQPTLALVLKIEFLPVECGRLRNIEIHALDADGNPFAPAAALQVTPERNPQFPQLPVSVQLVLNLHGIVFNNYGSRQFSILVDGNEIASVPVHIVARPPAPA
jgi:hypothetical protein